MLVLTRRVGESIRIGDHVRLTIRGKVRNHYTVAIVAPGDLSIVDGDGEPLTALRHRQRHKRRYVAALLAGECLRIGDAVHVLFGEDRYGGTSRLRSGQQVRISIDAPREVSVHREEIYWRIWHQSRERPGRAA